MTFRLWRCFYLKKDPDQDHDQWSCPYSWPEGYSETWYPNGALRIVLLWKLIENYKNDYYERPHIERLTKSRGANRREAIFMETQICTPAVFFSFSPCQHSPAVDFPPTRKTDTWGSSQFIRCKHLVKSPKQEFDGKNTKLRIDWNWIARVTCWAQAVGTSWSDKCKSDNSRLIKSDYKTQTDTLIYQALLSV